LRCGYNSVAPDSCPQSGQIKALKTRIKTLEEKVAKGVAAPGEGSYKGGDAEEEEEEVDPKDEM
jgi:hypothetical protein